MYVDDGCVLESGVLEYRMTDFSYKTLESNYILEFFNALDKKRMLLLSFALLWQKSAGFGNGLVKAYLIDGLSA